MTPVLRTFKRVAVQVAQHANLKISVFNHERGLVDFLLDKKRMPMRLTWRRGQHSIFVSTTAGTTDSR
jgi:hypothetical protein